MEAIGEPGMFADHRVTENPVPVGYGLMSSENPSGGITFPKVKGGIVTQMTMNPMNGMIAEMHIEKRGSGILFPEEIRFDLNAIIHVTEITIDTDDEGGEGDKAYFRDAGFDQNVMINIPKFVIAGGQARDYQ